MTEICLGQPMKEWVKFLIAYKFAIDEVRTKLNILNEEFQTVQDYNPQ